MRSFPILQSLLFATSISYSQQNSRLIDDFDHSRKLQHWRFSNGPEFPGASGSLLLGSGHQGRGAILKYRFTCSGIGQCGHYVAAIWNAPSRLDVSPGAALALVVRLSPEVRLVLRVMDETGQTLQFYMNAPSLEHRAQDEWQPLFIPLTGNADGYWGGADTGRIAGRIATIAILADSRFPEAAEGQMAFDDLRLLATADASFQIDASSKLNPAPDTAGQLRPRWGVNIHFVRDDRALDAARDAGFSFVRMDLLWAAVERQGRYNFAPFDELMRALEARGMGALWILDYGHPEHGGKAPQSPKDFRAYARYAAAAVAHFRGHNARFEIWNEPNITRFLPNPSIYPELLRASLDVIRHENPSAPVSTAGISGMDFAFFKRMLESGSAGKASAIAMHPYRDAAPETLPGDMVLLQELVRRTLGPDIPLWDTEWGYSSSGSWLKDISHDGHSPTARNWQAVIALRECLTVWALGLPVAVWYDLRDDGANPFDRESNFGLLDRANRDKPAMKAIRTLANLARDHSYVGLIDELLFGTHAMRLDGKDDIIFIVWKEDSKSRTYVRIPQQELISATDLFGRITSPEGTDGRFKVFPLEEWAGPLYFRMRRPRRLARGEPELEE